jgi:hypothetical protein
MSKEDKIEETILKKYNYYIGQRDKALGRYMDSGKIVDRISAIRCTESVKRLEEVIAIIRK